VEKAKQLKLVPEDKEKELDNRLKESFINLSDSIIGIGKQIFLFIKSVGFILFYLARISIIGLKSIWSEVSKKK